MIEEELDELKERLKSFTKEELAISYTIWPYSPEEYKGKRYGNLPDEFLRWIVKKFSDSLTDRNKFLATKAKAEIKLRSKISVSRRGVPFRRAVVKPVDAKGIFVRETEPIKNTIEYIIEDDEYLTDDDEVARRFENELADFKPIRKKKKPTQSEEENQKPKKHGIEL
jgi:hypothetical protein